MQKKRGGQAVTKIHADNYSFRLAKTDTHADIIKVGRKLMHTGTDIPHPTETPIVGVDSQHHQRGGPEVLDKGQCQHSWTSPPIACAEVDQFVVRGWWVHHCTHTYRRTNASLWQEIT